MEEETAWKFDFSENTKVLSWMTKDFFELVIKQYQNDQSAEVHNFEISPGAKPGENFASVIFRCTIHFSTKFEKNQRLKVVMKTMPEKWIVMKDKMGDSDIFAIEMKMYEKALPVLKGVWKNAGFNSTLCPGLVYQASLPNPVIILEDISEKGFQMNDKPPEDFEESKIIAKQLARFHAGSYFLANRSTDSIDFSNFNFCMYKTILPEIRRSLFDQTIEIFCEELATWEDFEKYVPKLNTFMKNYVDKLIKIYEVNQGPNAYNVLNHGDHHPKNMMYIKNSDGKITETCFLDFQISIWASPAIDLIYSLQMDMSAENRLKYRDEYIAYYHNEFTEALKQFGYTKKAPSLLDLQIEILKNGALEVVLEICFTIFFHVDWSKTQLDLFSSSESVQEFKRSVFRKPEFQKVIKQDLMRYIQKGIL